MVSTLASSFKVTNENLDFFLALIWILFLMTIHSHLMENYELLLLELIIGRVIY